MPDRTKCNPEAVAAANPPEYFPVPHAPGPAAHAASVSTFPSTLEGIHPKLNFCQKLTSATVKGPTTQSQTKVCYEAIPHLLT
jgi:hypothetical protein